MKQIILSLMLGLTACDAPINNQIKESQSSNKGSVFSFNLGDIKLKASFSWYDGPYSTTTKASTLIISLFDNQGELYELPENYELIFDASMPSMGHGLDNEGFFKSLAPGVYKNDGIRFQMPGEWFFELYLIDYDSPNVVEELVYQWQDLL